MSQEEHQQPLASCLSLFLLSIPLLAIKRNPAPVSRSSHSTTVLTLSHYYLSHSYPSNLLFFAFSIPPILSILHSPILSTVPNSPIHPSFHPFTSPILY